MGHDGERQKSASLCVFSMSNVFSPSPGWYVLYLLQSLHHVICMQPTHRFHTALNRSPSTIVSRSSLSPIVLMSRTSCPGISFTFLTCSKCRWILVCQLIIFFFRNKGNKCLSEINYTLNCKHKQIGVDIFFLVL